MPTELRTITARVQAPLDDYLKGQADALERTKSELIIEALYARFPEAPKEPSTTASVSALAAGGREAAEFGHIAGRALCERLGRLVSAQANEFIDAEGRRGTVRTARGKNKQWGCLISLRQRVDRIICAHTDDGDTFTLIEVTPEVWEREQRIPPEKHGEPRPFTLLGMKQAKEFGTSLPPITLSEASGMGDDLVQMSAFAKARYGGFKGLYEAEGWDWPGASAATTAGTLACKSDGSIAAFLRNRGWPV